MKKQPGIKFQFGTNSLYKPSTPIQQPRNVPERQAQQQPLTKKRRACDVSGYMNEQPAQKRMKTNFIERNKIMVKKPVLDLSAVKGQNGFSFGLFTNNATPKTPLVQKFGQNHMGQTFSRKPAAEGKENSIKQFMKHNMSPAKTINVTKVHKIRDSFEAMSLEKPDKEIEQQQKPA